MAWVDIVAVLAIIQFIVFGIMVGGARTKYDVKAPAMAGHPAFERMFRVHLNTLEVLVPFLVALYLGARYWSPRWAALLGVVYLVGRVVYLVAYRKDPASRSLGFSLTMLPVVILLVATLIGAARGLAAG